MKMPIKWHRQNLKNRFICIERAKEDMQRAEERLSRDRADYVFYLFQIEEAERQGKDSFDADKFGYHKGDKRR